MPSPTPAKGAQLLWSWGAALVVSALLVWAGRHWPQPLLAQAWALQRPELPLLLALALVLLPPLLLGAWLLRGLRRPPHPDRGESTDCAQGER